MHPAGTSGKDKSQNPSLVEIQRTLALTHNEEFHGRQIRPGANADVQKAPITYLTKDLEAAGVDHVWRARRAKPTWLATPPTADRAKRGMVEAAGVGLPRSFEFSNDFENSMGSIGEKRQKARVQVQNRYSGSAGVSSD